MTRLPPLSPPLEDERLQFCRTPPLEHAIDLIEIVLEISSTREGGIREPIFLSRSVANREGTSSEEKIEHIPPTDTTLLVLSPFHRAQRWSENDSRELEEYAIGRHAKH